MNYNCDTTWEAGIQFLSYPGLWLCRKLSYRQAHILNPIGIRYEMRGKGYAGVEAIKGENERPTGLMEKRITSFGVS